MGLTRISIQVTGLCGSASYNAVIHIPLQVKNLSLNARSTLPKCHDLFAMMCMLDILAVTETFLDSSIKVSELCPPITFCFIKTALIMVVVFLLLSRSFETFV